MLTRTPLVSSRIVSFPKRDESVETCQDDAANTDRVFALADGVSSSLRSRYWAQSLVRHFIDTPPRNGAEFTRWVQSVRDVYAPHFDRWLSTASERQQEKGRESGSQATFVGLCLDPDKRRYTFYSIGDCFLYHLSRTGELVYSYADPSPAPDVIGSLTPEDESAPRVYAGTRRFAPGDTLLLTSDALGYWLRGEIDRGHKPNGRLMLRATNSEWLDWITKAREHQDRNERLMDDDTTLLIVTIPETLKAAKPRKGVMPVTPVPPTAPVPPALPSDTGYPESLRRGTVSPTPPTARTARQLQIPAPLRNKRVPKIEWPTIHWPRMRATRSEKQANALPYYCAASLALNMWVGVDWVAHLAVSHQKQPGIASHRVLPQQELPRTPKATPAPGPAAKSVAKPPASRSSKHNQDTP